MKSENLLETEETIISPDLALYEVANNIWKHQFLLETLVEGQKYISLLLQLIDSGSIVLIRPDIALLKHAYEIAGRQKISIYDATFLALSLETGLGLKSLDREMLKIFNKFSGSLKSP